MYKILEQNGVENENIDGGAFNNFAAAGRDGIIAGVLTECALAATGNSISISSGLLIICGIRVKITSAEVLSISVPPVSPTSYQIIAEVTLQSNGDMAVSFYLRSPAALQQDMLYSQGYGTYQAEIGSFVYNPDGSITNIVRTIDVLYGGSGSGANIEIGTVTTSTLPAGTDAEFDVTVRKPDGTRKTVLDIMACIPQGRDGAPGSDGKDGQNGTTFTPHIDDSGNLSWTNDGDKQNPAAVNIKGAPGLAGEDGEIALTLVVLYPDEVKKGGVYRFASAEFNRTPHTGERFNFFTAANQMGTGEVRSGIEWECVEVVSTKGDTGTPQLFLKSIIDKSPSTITAYWFDYTEFNRTPVVGDICSSTWGHNGKSWLVNGEITELRNGNEARYDITSMVETTGETGAAGAGFWETTAEIPTTANGLTIDISQTSLTRAPVEGDFLISKAAATVFNVGQVIATAPDSMKVNYFANIKGEKGEKGDTGATGANGRDGADGTTFTPFIDSSGNLSWTNDGGKPNPASVNIKGDKGDKGEKGADGNGNVNCIEIPKQGTPLSDFSWKAIKVISEKFNAANWFKLGDTKTFTLGGNTFTARLVDRSYNGQAGMVFFATTNAAVNYQVLTNEPPDNTGGWGSAPLRTTLNDTVINTIQEDLRNIIKSVPVKYGRGGSSVTSQSEVSSVDCKLFLPSISELQGNSRAYVSGYVCPGDGSDGRWNLGVKEGEQLQYFKNNPAAVTVGYNYNTRTCIHETSYIAYCATSLQSGNNGLTCYAVRVWGTTPQRLAFLFVI